MAEHIPRPTAFCNTAALLLSACCGHDFMKPGMKVKLVKEPDNAYDAEAIKVMMKGVGLVGYVANSVYTVKGESWSAGRIYDHIGKKAKGTVKVVLPDGVICKLDLNK